MRSRVAGILVIVPEGRSATEIRESRETRSFQSRIPDLYSARVSVSERSRTGRCGMSGSDAGLPGG